MRSDQIFCTQPATYGRHTATATFDAKHCWTAAAKTLLSYIKNKIMPSLCPTSLPRCHTPVLTKVHNNKHTAGLPHLHHNNTHMSLQRCTSISTQLASHIPATMQYKIHLFSQACATACTQLASHMFATMPRTCPVATSVHAGYVCPSNLTGAGHMARDKMSSV